MGRLIFFVFIIVAAVMIAAAHSQEDSQPRRVEILHANSLEFDRNLGPDVRRLIGDVRLKHEDALMYCDSAYLFSGNNIVHAYGNVHINQGDTVHLRADFIRYFGEKRFAEARGNVELYDDDATLTTDSLDYDIERNVAFYPSGGRIVSGESIIESIRGYYYSNDKVMFFKDEVNVVTPDYRIKCDTLKYNTETETAFFLGPSTIITEDLHIYCENGWHNTQTDISQFNKNAVITHENQVVKADSFYYDHSGNYGKGFFNVEMTDTVERIVLYGHYSLFEREPEYTMITDSALFVHYDEENDSLFLHADTLESFFDSTGEYRILNAFYGARFFSEDLQGQCDSLYYTFQDSIIRMYTEPVLWNNETQLTADYMEIHSKDEEIDHVIMNGNAFIVSFEEGDYYNQIKGRDMTGYFNEGELSRVRVVGNAETLYYPKEEEEIIGVNVVASTTLMIFMKDNSPERIRFETNPEATLYPLEDMSGSELFLKDFKWLEEIRPLSKEDLFKK